MGLQDDDLFLAGTWEKDIDKFGKGIDMIVTKYGELMKVSRETKLSFWADGAANVKQQLEQSRLATAQYKEEVVKLQLEIGKLNKAQQEAAKTTTLQARAEQQETKSIREKTKALADELRYKQQLEKSIAKEEAAVKKQQSAYQLLNAEYQKRAAKAKNLAVIYGTEDTMAKRAADSANKLADQLKKIDATVGQSQRNVGNYKSQWNGVNNSIQQLVREVPSVANNLAMLPLALSNNWGAFVDSLKQARIQNELLKASGQSTIPVWKQVATSFFSLQTAIAGGIALLVAYSSGAFDAEKKTGGFADSLKSAGNAYAEAKFEIEAYKKAFEDTTTSMAQKEAMLEHYNKTWGDQAGHLKTVGELEAFLASKAQAFIDTLFLRAKATAALAAATELLTENLKHQANGGKDLVPWYAKAAGFLGSGQAGGGAASIYIQTAAGADALTDANNKTTKSVEALKKMYLDFSGQAADMAKANGFDLDGKKNKKDPKAKQPTDLNNTLVQAQKEINEAVHQVLIEGLEADRDTNKQYADDEKNALQDRINAYENYAFFRESIADEQRKKELEAAGIQNAKILHDVDTANASQAEKDKVLLVQSEAFAQQKVNIQAKYDGEVSKIALEGTKDRQAMAESDIKEQLSVIMQGAQDIENQVRESENRKLVLLESYAKLNNWSDKKTQEERKKIIDAANLDIFDAQQTYFKNYLEDLEKQGIITKEVLNKIMSELAQVRPNGAKNGDPSSLNDMLGINEQGVREAQTYLSAIEDVIGAIGDLVSHQYQLQIDALQSVADKRKEGYDKEVEYINSLYISDKERAERLADLKAKNTLDELAQQRRINDVKRKQARAEKTANTAEAVGKTAIAVLNALSVKPWYLGLALSVAAGITGAAQIATIQSTPLPQYAKGRGFGKSEFAVVNERGAEAIVDRSGKVRIANEGAEGITYLGANERVFTADETQKIMNSAVTQPISMRRNKSVDDQFAAQVYERVGNRIVAAVKGNRSKTTVIIQDKAYIQRISRH